MEYRLVKLDTNEEYIQIFNEETSNLIGSVVKNRRLLLIPVFSLRFDDTVLELNRGLLRFRRWKIDSTQILLSWKVLKTELRVQTESEEFTANKPSRGKITLSNSQGRTALIVDLEAFSSKDMLRLQTFDRLDDNLALGIAVLMIEYFDLW